MKILSILLFAFISLSFYGQTFNGNWKSIGYGRVLSIKNNKYKLKDYTSKSCTLNSRGKLTELTNRIKLSNDTLQIKMGINDYFFVRANSKFCKNTKTKKNDPIYNFEVLAETFKNHYAFFDLRNINWQKMYETYRSKITSKTTKPELFLVFYEMLNEFHDGHLDISVPENIEKKAIKLLLKNVKINDSVDEQINEWDLAKKVSETFLDSIKSKRNGIIRWGIFNNNIGYLQINQMLGFANYKITNTNDFISFWKKYLNKTSNKSDVEIILDERSGVKSIMNEVMKDLINTKALIVDVRFNGGGNDAVSLEILKYFNRNKKQIGTKKAQNGDGFTKETSLWLEAYNKAYTKPVYLLTSKATASAAEVFVMATLSLNHFTRIGGNTEGIFSDMLDKKLPNGWEFSLSNEIYFDKQANNYELTGIKPDVLLYKSNTIPKQFQQILNEINNMKDKAVLKTIEMINQ